MLTQTALSLKAFFIKIKFYGIIALTINPILWLVERITEWHLTNVVYATLVLGAVAVDHILGTLYHAFWVRDFSLKKNTTGLITKLVIVVSVGYLFEGLHELMQEVPGLRDYTIMTLRLMVFLYPAGSAFSLSYEITNKKFPPMGFMEWVKKFSKYESDEKKS